MKQLDNINDLPSLKLFVENYNFKLENLSNKLVFGDGSTSPNLLIIGEAPGAEEEKQLLPFVGASGKILQKILNFLNLKRKEVYITNTIDFRPPNNRVPKKEEILEYLPILLKKIEILKPKIILTLGSTASNYLLKSNLPISKLRENIHSYKKISVICSYHPSFLLRKGGSIDVISKDLQLLKNLLQPLKKSDN